MLQVNALKDLMQPSRSAASIFALSDLIWPTVVICFHVVVQKFASCALFDFPFFATFVFVVHSYRHDLQLKKIRTLSIRVNIHK